MSWKIQATGGVLSLLLLVLIFELIRRRRLKEEYALLWLLAGIAVLIFVVFPNLLSLVARLTGLYYLTALFAITFLFLLIIVLHFSTVISQQSEKEVNLAQKLAILEWRLRQIERKIEKAGSASANNKDHATADSHLSASERPKK